MAVAMAERLAQSQILTQEGVNTALPPDLIVDTQVGWGRNVTVRKAKPATRPGIRRLCSLPSGVIQAIGVFKKQNGVLLAVIGGRLYRAQSTGVNFEFSEVVLPYVNNPDLLRAYMQQAEDHMIIGDGESRPIIYDGATARRATITEVPMGTWMAYGNGRLWIAVDRNRVQAGDITGTGAATYLNFTETGYMFGAGAFHFPAEITALAFLPMNDTTTGFGGLLVGGEDWMAALKAEVINRMEWANTASMQTTVYPHIGIESGHCVVPVNQDLYFRSEDGVRSYRSTAVDLQTPGQTSISEEMERVIDYDTRRWLRYAQGVYFDNRLIITHTPCLSYHDGSIMWQGLAVLEFAPIQKMGQKSMPAWAGSWDGPLTVAMTKGRIEGEERCFIAARELSGGNALHELSRKDRWDSSWSYEVASWRRPTCHVEYMRFAFDRPDMIKRLVRVDIDVSELLDQLDVVIYYRGDQKDEWKRMDDRSVYVRNVADYPDALTDDLIEIGMDYRTGIWSQTPDYDNDPDHLDYEDVAFAFQLKVEWRGSCRIERVTAYAIPLPGSAYGIPEDETPTDTLDAAEAVPADINTEWPLWSE